MQLNLVIETGSICLCICPNTQGRPLATSKKMRSIKLSLPLLNGHRRHGRYTPAAFAVHHLEEHSWVQFLTKLGARAVVSPL